MKKPKRKTKASTGDDLLNQVIKLTGIPGNVIKRELKSILERKNLDPKHITMDELRSVVASYLREIMGGLLDKASRRTDHHH